MGLIKAIDSLAVMRHKKFRKPRLVREWSVRRILRDSPRFLTLTASILDQTKDALREVWALKALSSRLMAVSKPSKVLEDLVRRRREKYVALESAMWKDLEVVNLAVRKDMQGVCDLAKVFFKDCDDVMAELQDIFTFGQDADELSLEEEDFRLAWEVACMVGRERRGAVEELHQDLMRLERRRSVGAEEVYRTYLAKQLKVKVKPKYMIVHHFQQYVLRHNQMMLSNFRGFHELRLQLMLRVEGIKVTFRRLLQSAMDTWWDIARIRRNEAMLKLLNEGEEEASSDADQVTFPIHQDVVVALFREWLLDPAKDTLEGGTLPHVLDDIIDHLDSASRNLIDLYRVMSKQIFMGSLMTSRHSLAQGLSSTSLTPSSLRLEELEESVLRPLFILREDAGAEVEDTALEEKCFTLLLEMQTVVRGAYTFLHHIGTIWHRHFARVEEAGALVHQALARVKVVNGAGTMAFETKLSVALDGLRQGSTEGDLDKQLIKVNGLLDELRQLYSTNYERERDSVREYGSLLDAEAAVFKAEVDTFLQSCPSGEVNTYLRNLLAGSPGTPVERGEEEVGEDPDPDPDRDADSDLDPEVRREPETSPYRPIPREVKLCQLKVRALDKWKYGLAGAFHFFSLHLPEEMHECAELWMDAEDATLRADLADLLASHQARYLRVRLEVYGVRMAEVRLHNARLNSHREAVQQQLDQMVQERERLQEAMDTIMADMEVQMQDLEQQLEACTNVMAIRGLQAKVAEVVSASTMVVRTNIRQFVEEGEKKVGCMRDTTLHFLKAIRLFSEDGNFSAEEARAFTTLLAGVEASLTSHVTPLLQDAARDEARLGRRLQARADRLAHSCLGMQKKVEVMDDLAMITYKLQRGLRSEASRMKSDLKVITMKADQLLAAMATPDCTVESICADHWTPLLAALRRFHDYLVQPLDRGGTNWCSALRFTGFQEINSLSTVRTKLRKLAGGRHHADYSELLFGATVAPPCDASFMSIVCTIMWNALQNVQTVANTFYLAYAKVVHEEDVVPPQYDACVEEFLLRTKYYHMQCEEVWLDVVHGFMRTVAQLQVAANAFAELHLLHHHSCEEAAMVQMHSRFVVQLRTTRAALEEGRMVLGGALKLVHGYPANHAALLVLDQRVRVCARHHKDKMKAFVSSYVDFLQQQQGWSTAKAEEMVQLVQLVQDALFADDSLVQDLAAQVQDVLQGVEDEVCQGSSKVSLKEVKSRKGEKALRKQLKKKASLIVERYKREVIPPELTLDLESSNHYLREVRERIERLQQQVSSEVTVSRLSEDIPDLRPPPLQAFRLSLYADRMRKELDSARVQHQEYAERAYRAFKADLQAWLACWESNVNAVKAFYSVRYP